MKVTGYVVRRRCLGKWLAFADIQVTSGDIINVTFQRDSPSWNAELDHTFPTKSSSLPYGALIEMEICEGPKPRTCNQSDPNHGTANFEVHSWKMLYNPREEAMENAKQNSMGGMSCSIYLKERGKAFQRFNGDNNKNFKNKPKDDGNENMPTQQENETKTRSDVKRNSPSRNCSPDNAHGDPRAKGLRAKLFAAWILETFQDDDKTPSTVLDIAGGKGNLSVELALQGKLTCTVIDPMIRRSRPQESFLPKRQVKQLQKAEAPHPQYLATYFNQTTLMKMYASASSSSSSISLRKVHGEGNGEATTVSGETIIQYATLYVALHPDQATEDIIDMALTHRKSVAVVPCCVFADLFPHRRLAGCGTKVRTYEQFMEYLLQKDDRLKVDTLPFEGKNQVIYCKL